MAETVEERLRAAWARTDQIFEILAPDAWLAQPISLRHPFIFYVGHLPAFAWNHVCAGVVERPAFNAAFDDLVSRGIDPDVDDPSRCHDHPDVPSQWPALPAVLAYRDRVREAVLGAAGAVAERADAHTMAVDGRVFSMVIEHEEMHQETLHYIWHRLPFQQKRAPAGYRMEVDGHVPAHQTVPIDAGLATLGVDRGDVPFAWDNEVPSLTLQVPQFSIDRHDVTCAEFLEFVEAGGYRDERLWTADAWTWRCHEAIAQPLFWERHDGIWYWRGMFGLVPLPPAWPVYVSHAEAEAFAAWRGGRLPTEAEYHRAAFGAPGGHERALPWGDTPPDERHGNFGNVRYDPIPVGARPEGASAFGVHDLIGNGWEWTSSLFRPFPGFSPRASYPEYSADFFDDRHYVLKGASPATPSATVRRSFRNWFRPHYPYVYATFRLVRP